VRGASVVVVVVVVVLGQVASVEYSTISSYSLGMSLVSQPSGSNVRMTNNASFMMGLPNCDGAIIMRTPA
jgi:hypothetical protein